MHCSSTKKGFRTKRRGKRAGKRTGKRTGKRAGKRAGKRSSKRSSKRSGKRTSKRTGKRIGTRKRGGGRHDSDDDDDESEATSSGYISSASLPPPHPDDKNIYTEIVYEIIEDDGKDQMGKQMVWGLAQHLGGVGWYDGNAQVMLDDPETVEEEDKEYRKKFYQETGREGVHYIKDGNDYKYFLYSPEPNRDKPTKSAQKRHPTNESNNEDPGSPKKKPKGVSIQ